MSEDNPILSALTRRKPSIKFADLTPGLPFKWDEPPPFGNVVCLKLRVSSVVVRIVCDGGMKFSEAWTPLEGGNIGVIFTVSVTGADANHNVIPL